MINPTSEADNIFIQVKISTPKGIKNIDLYIHPDDVESYQKYVDLNKAEEEIKRLLLGK